MTNPIPVQGLSEALQACPHCGSSLFARVKPYPWEKEGEADLVWGYHVLCDASGFDNRPRGCGAASGWAETPAEAAEAWNTRALTELQHRREAEAGTPEEQVGQVARLIDGFAFEVDPPRKKDSEAKEYGRRVALATARRILAFLAASPSSPASGVRVKALEWQFEGGTYFAQSVAGRYSIIGRDGDWLCLREGLSVGYFDDGSIDLIKAAAQADYEARILSALGEHS